MPTFDFRRPRTPQLVLAAVLLAATASAANAEPKVVTSIKPIQSLVAGVMEGVGEPDVIVEGAGSPHAYAMKPSQAGMLQDADLVFWVGPELETFLAKPIETLGSGKSVALMAAALGRPNDDGHRNMEHEHDDHHAEHDHSAHEEGEHGDASKNHLDEASSANAQDTVRDDDHDHEHDHGGVDPHVWLNPEDAAGMVHRIEEALAEADPDNAAAYQANAEKLEARLSALGSEIETTVAPIKDAPFVVFHDAYQHFSERFDIAPIATVTISPDRTPSAAHVSEVKALIETTGASCVFAEPQFEPKLIDVLIEGTNARSATLDPLGARISEGPELYFELMTNLAGSLADCLSAQS